MTHVKLMGEIGEKFGTDWNMNVSNFRDVFRLIECQTEGFREYLVDCAEKGVNFTIQNGEDLLDGHFDALIAPVKDTVVITPVAAGAGVKDALKIIAGALLLYYGASFIKNLDIFTTTESVEVGSKAVEVETLSGGTQTINIPQYKEVEKLNNAGVAATKMTQAAGVRLGMEGVMGYLTPDSPIGSEESYLFDGPENNIQQGVAVPLLYGQLMVGGSVINYGLEEVALGEYANQGYVLVTEDSVTAYNTPYGTGSSSDSSSTGTTTITGGSGGKKIGIGIVEHNK